MTGMDGGDSTRVLPSLVNSCSLLLQARFAWPLIHIAHEPQIALRQAQRTASDWSWYSRISMSASSTTACSGRSTVYV